MRLARCADPVRGKDQRRGRVDHSHRHPHQQPAKLLVLKRSQSPGRSRVQVSRIPDHRGERQQRSQCAAMRRRAKDVQGGRSIVHDGSANAVQCGPENQRAQEEAEVLRSMYGIGGQSRLVQRRDMPDPEGDSFDDPRRKRRHNKLHHTRGFNPLRNGPNPNAMTRYEGPQASRAGMRRSNQGCRDQDQNLVLQHVSTE